MWINPHKVDTWLAWNGLEKNQQVEEEGGAGKPRVTLSTDTNQNPGGLGGEMDWWLGLVARSLELNSWL